MGRCLYILPIVVMRVASHKFIVVGTRHNVPINTTELFYGDESDVTIDTTERFYND